MDILVAYAAETAQVADKATGIASIGLDPKALLFQIINFVILLVILRWVAYRPILTVLANRRRVIEQSLEEARLIEESKAELVKEREAVLAQAQKKADVLLEETKQRAHTMVQEAEAQAAKRTERIMEEAQEQLTQEVRGAKRTLRQETLTLVKEATEIILQEKLDTKKDEQLLEKAIERVAKGAKV